MALSKGCMVLSKGRMVLSKGRMLQVLHGTPLGILDVIEDHLMYDCPGAQAHNKLSCHIRI